MLLKVQNDAKGRSCFLLLHWKPLIYSVYMEEICAFQVLKARI